MSLSDNGLICAYGWNGAPSGPLDWQGLAAAGHAPLLWVNLDRNAAEARQWLEQASGLDPLVVQALLQEDTRPRLTVHGDGLLVILRGVNLNPGEDPEDMVSIRLWMDDRRLVSLHGKPLRAVAELREALGRGYRPTGTGDLLATLAERLTLLMGPVLHELDDRLDEMEESLLADVQRAARAHLIALRRRGIILRRYIAPLRDVLSRLALERVPGLNEADRARLRECWDRVVRYVEDLEALRERATVAQEELASRLSDQMNRNMYFLTLVATLFLPMGFVTGLLGVNVGGIPGSEDPLAFVWLCLSLGGLGAAVAGFFYLRRWL